MEDYIELVASRSPASAGFSLTGGRATVPYLVEYGNVDAAVRELLGYVKPRGDGRLERGLPRAHPRWPQLYCESITSIQGIGEPFLVESVQNPQSNVIPYYAEYPYYIFNCSFAPRPYDLLDDSEIELLEDSYYDDAGATQQQDIAEEYKRFVEIDFQPQPELITAQYGQMVYYTTGAAPDGNTYPASPKTFVPKAALKVRWHFVPFSLVTAQNSPMIRQLGRVNQRDFVVAGRYFFAGQLLYVGVAVKTYVPPIPEFEVVDGTTTFSAEKVCDLEFVFEYTQRTATDAPTPTQNNWIVDGHNSFPWVHAPGEYFYVTINAPLAADAVPTYLSFPFEWLFTDFTNF